MFKIIVHATGSTGNCYSIIDDDHKILIDPGVPFKKLQEMTEFTTHAYDFVLLSHEHKDHSKAVSDLLQRGKICYMSQGTRDVLELYHSSALIVQDTFDFEDNNWRVMPFLVEHDAAEPFGFLILTPSGKKVCYATDTRSLNYRFTGVNYWLIEANYSKELMEESPLPETVKSRIRSSHFEIENVMRFFGKQDLSDTEAIYLIHLSDNNSDTAEFKAKIETITGKTVFV